MEAPQKCDGPIYSVFLQQPSTSTRRANENGRQIALPPVPKPIKSHHYQAKEVPTAKTCASVVLPVPLTPLLAASVLPATPF